MFIFTFAKIPWKFHKCQSFLSEAQRKESNPSSVKLSTRMQNSQYYRRRSDPAHGYGNNYGGGHHGYRKRSPPTGVYRGYGCGQNTGYNNQTETEVASTTTIRLASAKHNRPRNAGSSAGDGYRAGAGRGFPSQERGPGAPGEGYRRGR